VKAQISQKVFRMKKSAIHEMTRLSKEIVKGGKSFDNSGNCFRPHRRRTSENIILCS
jgi:hypothetical protein